MKLDIARRPVLFRAAILAVLSFLFVFALETSARASPRWTPSPEDTLADGDIDAEDAAARNVVSIVSSPTGGRTVAGSPAGSTWLSLVGFTRRTYDDRREIGGFLVLGLPLDRFARGSTRVASLPAADAADPRPELVRVTSASPTEIPVTPTVTSRLARACVAAAWRAAGLGPDDARLEAIASRARWSAILPEARLRAVRFEDAQLSFDTGKETSRLRDSSGAKIGFEARLTWRLDRLIYADDEPSFERMRIEHRDARARVAAKVLDALFHWQRATLDLRTLPPSQQGTRDEADVVLRVVEAEAALDVLTNGWFGAHVQHLQKRSGFGGSAAPANRDEAEPGDL
jgi:hypothetical protein